MKRYRSEHALEEAFIQPVLDLLGWKLKYQPKLQGRTPDYALFLSDEALDAALAVDHTSLAFWSPATVVGDAKGWDISLDRPISGQSQREYPPQQIEWYVDRSGLDFGILTNGRQWRIFPRSRQSHQPRFNTYFEFDLEMYLREYDSRLRETLAVDDALYFYLLFGPIGFRELDDRKPLIVRAIEGSSAYRIGVGEDLRARAFEAVRLATEGFLSFEHNDLNAADHLSTCQRASFTLIYRLLFIMFAEDRGLLPYATSRLYRENRSLRRHRDDIATQIEQIKLQQQDDFSRESHAILDDLRDLFDLVDSGRHSYDVPAYNGGLFDASSHTFLQEKQLSDWYLARVIDQLGRASDPELQDDGLFRVDYRDLAIQHLGSIYEGLLELQPRRAAVKMKVVFKHARQRLEEKVIPAAHPDPEGFEDTGERYEVGQVYLETNKGERRATGSYYTPDHIVNHIIENTLGPLCRRIQTQLESEINELENHVDSVDESVALRIARLKGDFDDRLLKLRILDPAMGSGHFLLRACSFLAEEIATHPWTATEESEEESTLSYWKRRVSESCLYGVDQNEMAVELAKLAMWLETVAIDRPLTFLDHHFRNGNSLVGAGIAELGALPDETGLFSQTFVRTVEQKTHLFLETLGKIERTPSTVTAQVKQKERLLKKLERVRSPFRGVADVWCSVFALPEGERVHGEDYRRLIDLIGRPKKFATVMNEEAFVHARNAVRNAYRGCFHWELEFPEVFFDADGRRVDSGFDAIIGNPPYDVLSELETGRDLSAFRAFLEAQSTYQPSFRGKNNLYKLFVCRALELLADGGYFGFITPMAVLGDDQAADLRRAILGAGTFTVIESFPQKDNRRKRVFPDAKLSTAIIVIHKCEPETADAIEFTSRVHPGRDLEANSPTLRMCRRDIPLYDPSNYTLISCSQTDLQLSVRIMNTGRMRRLRDVAEFFQGEVNETVQRRKGTVKNAEGGRFRKLVTRGANICLYVLREASQGKDIFLDVERFLEGASEDSKAFHHRHERIGLQESSPQNNFRRIIAARVYCGEFCNHTVNYCPTSKCLVELELVLSLLNSKLADWYFRLGSTNAHVSHYQLYNLPFPRFAEVTTSDVDEIVSEIIVSLTPNGSGLDAAWNCVAELTIDAPFDPALRKVIVAAVQEIERIEIERGAIARSDRSSLAAEAQPYQDFIDRLLFAMAGLSDEEAAGVVERLAGMM